MGQHKRMSTWLQLVLVSSKLPEMLISNVRKHGKRSRDERKQLRRMSTWLQLVLASSKPPEMLILNAKRHGKKQKEKKKRNIVNSIWPEHFFNEKGWIVFNLCLIT